MSYHAQIRRDCGPETCPTIDRVQSRIGAALAILKRSLDQSTTVEEAGRGRLGNYGESWGITGNPGELRGILGRPQLHCLRTRHPSLRRGQPDELHGDDEAARDAMAAIAGEPAELEKARATAGSMRDTLADALRRIDELEKEREDLAGDVNALRERAEEAEARAETAEGDARRYAEEAADSDL